MASSKRTRIPSPGRRSTVAVPDPVPWCRLATPALLGLTLATALLYFGYSFLSDGLYQHDEAAHFLNMRGFWSDPHSILGNWAKPGYKVLFVGPAYFGPWPVLIAHCLVAAGCCYFTYRLAEAAGSRAPLLAFVLLAAQPFWLQLSFRTYSEPLTALLLLGALLLHQRRNLLGAALLASYLPLVRQELYVLVALYGLYLAYGRHWLPVLALLTFPLLNNAWGWAATGDPLYLLHQLTGFGDRIGEAYPRQGFDHFFLMSLTVFGALALTALVVYLGQVLLLRRRVHPFILTPLALYFLVHALLNLQSFPVGPGTGGNLRYLLVIAPLTAVLGALALEHRPTSRREYTRLACVLLPFLLVVGLFMSHGHDNVRFDGTFDPRPLAMTLAAVPVLLFARGRMLLPLLLACAVGFTVLSVQPLKKKREELMVKTIADWGRENGLDRYPILVNHSLFYYYYGKARHEFENGAGPITAASVDAAAPGTHIIWDAHYSYRPELNADHLNYTYFDDNPARFRALGPPLVSPNRRFGIHVYMKIGR